MTTDKVSVSDEAESASTKPKVSRVKWFIAGGCGFALIVILICVAVWFFAMRGAGGEPANAVTAERVTKEFVEALYNGDVESAYDMFDAEIHAQQSLDEFKTLLARDANFVTIEEYNNLKVCEFQLLFGNKGRVLVAQGLIHHENGEIFFSSSLREDSDKVWRVLGFHTDSDADTKPWGACQYD
ncbi:MAG: hypothetical protein GY832_38945 [Chloroflexi bacterium]|nr:hypothetical protein [Chloroflexota bacterium]